MKQTHVPDQIKPEGVAELKAQSVTKMFQRRETIFHREDTPKYLYVLLEGVVCVFDDTPGGVRNILTIIREPMDCFAEVYLFIDEKLPFSTEAMRKNTVLMTPHSVLHRFPQINRNLDVMPLRKVYTPSQKLKLLMKDSLRGKIMEYMQQRPDVLLKRHELANFLGVSRPALSRELCRMMNGGFPILGEHGNLKTVMQIITFFPSVRYACFVSKEAISVETEIIQGIAGIRGSTIVSKVLTRDGSTTLFALAQGEGIQEYMSTRAVLAIVLEGRIIFTVDREEKEI